MDGDTAWLCVPTALAGLLDELRASGPGTAARTRRPVRRVRALAGLAGIAARPVHGLGVDTPAPITGDVQRCDCCVAIREEGQ